MSPEALRTHYPALWTTSGKGFEEVLPPHPQSLYQAHELGWHAAVYKQQCEDHDRPQGSCEEVLKQAATVLGVSKVTPAQLTAVRGLLKDLDEQQSLIDRVRGFFSFVNVMWLVSITGILCTAGPAVAVVVGPVLSRIVSHLIRQVVVPIVKALHKWGVFEACAYALALAFSIQGSRYPAGQADAAKMVALTGGLSFLPCWMYSTSLHVTSQGGNKELFATISNAMFSAVLAPLAMIHDSQLIGFLTMLAVYGALGFCCGAFGLGYYIGFNNKDALGKCVVASICLMIIFTFVRLGFVDLLFMRPFATAAMCLGNIMYFLGLLIWSSQHSYHGASYKVRQGIMLGSLLVALFVGNVLALRSMANTATTFLVLWLMEKQLEVRFGSMGIVVVFANFVFLYFVSHYLHTHPEIIMSLFDPTGLYL